MAGKKQPEPEVPPSQHWVCEGCWSASQGVSPPDACDVCGHEYFENLQDMLEERAEADATTEC